MKKILADATHSKLRTRPTMLIRKARWDKDFWSLLLNLWNEIARASFRVNYTGQNIPIDVTLRYDGGKIFR